MCLSHLEQKPNIILLIQKLSSFAIPNVIYLPPPKQFSKSIFVVVKRHSLPTAWIMLLTF